MRSRYTKEQTFNPPTRPHLRPVVGLGDLGLVPELRREEAVPEALQLPLALQALVVLQPLHGMVWHGMM